MMPARCGGPRVPGHWFCRTCQVHFNCRGPRMNLEAAIAECGEGA